MKAVRGAMLLPEGVREVTAVVEGRRITSIRAPRRGDPAAPDGLLVPGFVNAHLHLELSWLGGVDLGVPEGAGFIPWMKATTALRTKGVDPGWAKARAALAEMVKGGTSAAYDVSNSGGMGPILAEGGIQGVAALEVLGFGQEQVSDRLAVAQKGGGWWDGDNGPVIGRPAPHAVFSTSPELIKATAGHGAAPSTMHIAEDVHESQFLRDGTGPFADLLDELNVSWRWWKPPGTTVVPYLDSLGVLRPRLTLVHGVHLTDEDMAILAAKGPTLVLCPRSNLRIGGKLPDVPALLAAGVRLAVGTDSLGSSPDLDVLAEIRVLAHAFPEVDPLVWMRLATAGGADAVGLNHVGRIANQTAPGLVLLHGVKDLSEVFGAEMPKRSWLVPPGGPP
jgi:cytosine/adenosine deaminase-related metal-dependent hydrolase